MKFPAVSRRKYDVATVLADDYRMRLLNLWQSHQALQRQYYDVAAQLAESQRVRLELTDALRFKDTRIMKVLELPGFKVAK